MVLRLLLFGFLRVSSYFNKFLRSFFYFLFSQENGLVIGNTILTTSKKVTSVYGSFSDFLKCLLECNM